MAQHNNARKLLPTLFFLLLAGGGFLAFRQLFFTAAPQGRCIVAARYVTPPALTTDSIARRSEQLRQMLGEMDYYERTHSVADEGYQQVMDLRGYLQESLEELSKPVERVCHLTLYARPTTLYDVRCLLRRHLCPDEAARDTLMFVPRLVYETATQKLTFCREDSFGRLDYPDGSRYRGSFVHRGSPSSPHSFVRQGHGVFIAADGTYFQGRWDADTLISGVRYRDGERYEGGFDARMRPSGYGVLKGESYYEGEWLKGGRHGYGIGLVPGRIVCNGTWRNDRFRGESIVHNEQRVYGIDISRYQHERGKNKYPILWEGMRITNLGRKIPKQVEGSGTFPVRFCYVKATQGVTLVSDYAQQDMYEGRRAGIHMGQYHFFSPLSGKEQAEWFLQHASLQRGDLPPMLDVELSDKQIESMGGDEALMREMAAWIAAVKEHCHTTPVLYVNQNFVDTRMAAAPAIVRQCPVWVARYSEYRPYVRLAFWQMSDDGSVRGITPQVDIDVFNGTLAQFEQFVRDYQIR